MLRCSEDMSWALILLLVLVVAWLCATIQIVSRSSIYPVSWQAGRLAMREQPNNGSTGLLVGCLMGLDGVVGVCLAVEAQRGGWVSTSEVLQ